MQGIKRVKGGKTEQVWETVGKKIVLYIDEARALDVKPREYQLSIVHDGVPVAKTDYSSKSSTPSWQECFFFELSGRELVLEIKFKKALGRTGNVGKYVLGVPEDKAEAQETVWEDWCDLERVGAAASGAGTPSVRIRMFVSSVKELRPIDKATNKYHEFFYGQYWDQIKSGDLLLFEGSGLVPATLRAISGCKYSSVGLIVELPNKYTEENDKYVLEVTRNADDMVDSFSDIVRVGVTLFNLRERIHQFFGRTITWMPLKEPLNVAQHTELIQWVWETHAASTPIAFLVRDQPALASPRELAIGQTAHFLRDRFSADAVKQPLLAAEIFAAPLLVQALERFLPRSDLASVTSWVPDDFISLSAYSPPIQIRTTKSLHSSFNAASSSSSSSSPSSSQSKSSPNVNDKGKGRPKPGQLRRSYSRSSDAHHVSQNQLPAQESLESLLFMGPTASNSNSFLKPSQAFSPTDRQFLDANTPSFRARNGFQIGSLGIWANQVNIHIPDEEYAGRYKWKHCIPFFQKNTYDQENGQFLSRHFWFLSDKSIGVQVVATRLLLPPIVRPDDRQLYTVEYITPPIPGTENVDDDTVSSVALSSLGMASSYNDKHGQCVYAETVTIDKPGVHRILNAYMYEPDPSRPGFRRSSNYAYFDSIGIPSHIGLPQAIRLADEAFTNGQVPLVQWGSSASNSSYIFSLQSPDASQLISQARSFCLQQQPKN